MPSLTHNVSPNSRNEMFSHMLFTRSPFCSTFSPADTRLYIKLHPRLSHVCLTVQT